MRHNPASILFVALSLLVGGCKVSIGSDATGDTGGNTAGTTDSAAVAIDSVEFLRDNGGQPGEPITTLSPSDQKFHILAKLNHIERNLKVRLVWNAVDTTAGKNIEIAAADFEGLAANQVTGEFSLPRDWPVGAYRLDIFLNGVLTKTVPMMVQ